MRVLMIETRKGTEDGFTIREYIAGHEYDLREHLARAFLAAGFAIPIENRR